jgi:hypothetical protein
VKLFPLLDLEGDDYLFHELHPVLALAGHGAVLSQLKEHRGASIGAYVDTVAR